MWKVFLFSNIFFILLIDMCVRYFYFFLDCLILFIGFIIFCSDDVVMCEKVMIMMMLLVMCGCWCELDVWWKVMKWCFYEVKELLVVIVCSIVYWDVIKFSIDYVGFCWKCIFCWKELLVYFLFSKNFGLFKKRY